MYYLQPCFIATSKSHVEVICESFANCLTRLHDWDAGWRLNLFAIAQPSTALFNQPHDPL